MFTDTSIFTIEPGQIIGYTDSGKPIHVVAGGSEPLYDGTGEGQQGTGGDGNPAWQPFLEAVPQEYHEKVTPLLQEWDKNVNNRFEKVHSDYADFKPFKDNGVTRAQLEQGLNLLNAISADPLQVYKAMKEAYKFEDDTAPAGQGQQEPKVDEEPWKKGYEELRTNYETVAKVLVAKQEAEENARQDKILADEFDRLKTAYGSYDEEWVLAKLMVDPRKTPEAAVKEFKAWESQQQARFGPKPLFITGNGGVPSGNVDPRKLNDRQTRDLVAEMLQHAQRQQD